MIGDLDPDVVVVLSADHVYKLDYSKVVEGHVERRAVVTMVTTEVVDDDPSRFGLVVTDDEGRITDYHYKPDSPASNIAATEVFVFDAGKLIDDLDRAAREKGDEGDESSLEDLGEELLPGMVKAGDAFKYRLDGYWRDVGTLDSYWRSHMDLIARERGFDLDDPSWPILTLAPQRPPAHVYASARNVDTLISAGCRIKGDVAGSVLGPGVVVDEGATVRNSVLLHDAVVERGATVDTALVDMRAWIGQGASVGARTEAADFRDIGAGDIAVLGQGAVIDRGAKLPGGARVGASG